MAGTDTAGMVPGRFDVIIDGYGYCLLRTEAERGTYSWSDTFVARQNVGPAYGDNAQDFFLTVGQKDFSLGEEQRFYRIGDSDRERRYYTGTSVDPSVPGQVTLRATMPSLALTETACAVAETNVGTAGVYVGGTTKLLFVAADGTVTDKGAHGLGAIPAQWGVTTDGSNAYLSTSAGGTLGVRKWNGSAFSTFSATGVDSLAYLDNALYGYANDTGILSVFSTAGVASTLFAWKDAAGAALTGSSYATRLRAYGGLLYMLRKIGVRGHGEIWQYNGTGTSQIAEVPIANFVAQDIEVVSGITFISGYISRNSEYRPAICYLADTTIDLLWKSQTAAYTNATWPGMAAYEGGLAFTDDTTGKLMQYNLSTGGLHTMGSYTATNATAMMASSKDILVHTRNASTGYYFPSVSLASTGTVITSLIDFETGLTKQFRGVKADFTLPTGASVDIAYQVDALDGSWTNLQTAAVSGTEYTLSSVTGHAIAFKFTLNKGTSAGPTFKRYYVRAAPILQSYRQDVLLLDLSGRDGAGAVRLNDGSKHVLDGLTQATNLRTSLAAGAVTVTDRFGTYTALLEPGATTLREVRPEEFIAQVKLREV